MLPCVSSCSYFRGWTFTCLCVPLARCPSCEVSCVRVCYGCIRSCVAARADGSDGLLVLISGYRVPSLKLMATPHFRVLGQPTSWPAKPFSRAANWLDPSLTPPLTLHGSASHHPQRSLTTTARQAPGLVAGYLCRDQTLHYASNVSWAMMCMTIGSHDVPFASTRLGRSGRDPWCFSVFPPC